MAEEPIKTKMKVTTLPEEYKGWVDDGAIQFLQEPEQQNEVSTCIRKLSRIMKRLEGEKKNVCLTDSYWLV